MTDPIPARLHVLLARDDPMAVLIRRGPSRHVALIAWDRSTDHFVVGQWMKGRIYERRSDLSPDGKHLLYFAMNGRWDSEARGAWSAVSRVPELTARMLWAKGDCWHGGGLFLSSDELWLNDGFGHEILRDDLGLRRVRRHPWPEGPGGECTGVYYPRLVRDGWTQVSDDRDDSAFTVFEKSAGGGWTLRKIAHETIQPPPGRGCYYDEHELHDPRTGAVVERPGWEWAEVDGERLLWAEDGRLFAGRVGPKGVEGSEELFDANPLEFEAIAAAD